MNKSGEIIKKIVELEDEIQLKRKIMEIENRCLMEILDLIKKATRVNDDRAYNLFMKYKGLWEFSANVGVSGDSFIVTLPKKEALERGIKKGTPVLMALKTLRFFKP